MQITNEKNKVIEAAVSIVITSENRSFYEYELETIRKFMAKYVRHDISIVKDHALLLGGNIKDGHFYPDYSSEVLNKIFIPRGKMLNQEELSALRQKFNL